MTDSNTVELWSVMKREMVREFREPNFNDKILNQLLTLKQSGGYRGYAAKFRELQRFVKLDEQTATNLFVNGLSDMQMKRAVQRKQPTALSAAVQKGFLEWELQEKKINLSQTSLRSCNSGKSPGHGKMNHGGGKPTQQASGTGSIIAHGKQPVVKVDDQENPVNIQEKQILSRDYFCLLHTRSVLQCSKQDICIPNSNFIDSGATIDGVSPQFCRSNDLRGEIVDHKESMEVTLANKQTVVIPKQTVKITLYLDDFPPYTNDFLVIDVPEEQDILLGMPWLRKVNPDIDWVTERIQPRVKQEMREEAHQSRKRKV
ncbi:Hypothetical protein PHPALM_456 [Phytophthora palmivora]|uniref:Retrotransposon gag domain-containing protein n=1 Tax=Phytophthora palmivora TaxID=4796 RepID=A0A2P4YUR9_9STRA|nr:Hypothetical protein PHPALM_456 [Phytophthora palmivora]